MKLIITIFLLLFCLCRINSQVIYLNTNSDDILKLDINTCEYEFVVHVTFNITDISFHPDGSFYGITNFGQLIKIDTITGASNIIHDFDGQAFNSLTIAGDGIIYVTGDDGELWSYNAVTNQPFYHGDFGHRATGDLTFYKGNLYVAVLDDKIVLIDIDNPPASTVAIDDDIQGEIFGIVSYADNCDSINCYAISSGFSSIYLIDFQNQALQLLCNLDIRAGGGASTYEFLGSSPLFFDTITISQPTCNDQNGSITMNLTGGNHPLIFSLNNANFQSSNTFDQLPGGTYNIMVTDANGCTIEKQVSLQETNGPVIETLSMVAPTCEETNGEIEVILLNPDPTLTYSIDGITFQSSPVFLNVSPGWYIVTVEDTAGCTDMDSIKVFDVTQPRIDTVVVMTQGCNEDEFSLLIIPTDSTGIQYSIDGINFQADQEFDNLFTGNYMVTIKNEDGCRDSMMVSIEKVEPLVITNIVAFPTTCGKANGSILISGSGGTGIVQYSIDGQTFHMSNEFINLDAGQYTISVIDESGCTSNSTIEVLGSSVITVESIQSVTAECGKQNGSINISISGGTGIISLTINGGEPQPAGIISNLAGGKYDLVIKDETGCRLDSSVIVDQSECHIYIPNTFSPNQDGVNEVFQISSTPNFVATVKKYLIFDRWGNMVYSANDFPIASTEHWWDGTFRKISMSPGVFAYYIEVEDALGIKESYKGNVTLMR